MSSYYNNDHLARMNVFDIKEPDPNQLLVVFVFFGVVFSAFFAAKHSHRAGCRRKIVQELVTCPISLQVMKDPVTLVPSGHTFDRESICNALLLQPTRCPLTGVDYGRKLEYGDNIRIRQLVALYFGDGVYQKYNDFKFKLFYTALWNEKAYQDVAAYLVGMNKKRIDWKAVQQTVMNDYQDDVIVLGFKALLLHPNVFPSDGLEKDLDRAQGAWRRAEEHGLIVLAGDADAGGNEWAQWLCGMQHVIHENFGAAANYFKLAAAQGNALAQNSLGVLYQKDEQFDLAEYYYELAARQGQADAQYNLAMLHDPDVVRMRPHLEQAADQGHVLSLAFLEEDVQVMPDSFFLSYIGMLDGG